MDHSSTDSTISSHAHTIGSSVETNGRPTAMDKLTDRLGKDSLIRMGLYFYKERCPDTHMKDLVVDSIGEGREIVLEGQPVINFGSDSFLGLDRHPAVQQAIIDATRTWGTHNGSSRSFSSVQLAEEAEHRLARWLGVPDTLIFPSVSLANMGMLPSLAGKDDLLAMDRTSHDSLWQGAKIASANGADLQEFGAASIETLERLMNRKHYNERVVVVDGVYSMAGSIPPLKQLDELARRHGGYMYIDDAHGTGIIGDRGRGAAHRALGTLDHVMLVGSLSKAFSCLGGFVTTTLDMKLMLKMKAGSYVFGGPVPPSYLAGIIAVCDIIDSPEYDEILGRLHTLIARVTGGLRSLGLEVLGGESAIVSVVVGEIEKTLLAGRWLYDHGFYVQSAIYPAVSLTGGLLRIQVNANHTDEQVAGLLNAFADLASDLKIGKQHRSVR